MAESAAVARPGVVLETLRRRWLSRQDQALDLAMLAFSLGAALNLSTGQLALAAVAVVLVVRAALGDRRVVEAARDLGPAFAATLFLLVALVVSDLVTRVGWPGGFAATRWRPLLAIPLGSLALVVRGRPLALKCASVFALGCAVHAGVGLVQVFSDATPLADLLHIPADRRQVPAPGIPGLRSAVGLYYNRVRLSHVLAAGAAVATVLAVLQPRRRALLGLAGLVSLAGLVGTFGRAALMALFGTLVAAALGRVLWGRQEGRFRRLLLAVGALAVVSAVVLAVPPARARLSTALSFSENQDRLFLWGRGAEMAMDHAPAGTGFGGYDVVRNATYDRVNESFQSRAMSHNLVLSLLAETGLLGLLGWLWMWWALARRAWQSGSPEALAGLLGAATFHAATLAHDPLYQSECALAWGLCGALMAAPPAAPAREALPPTP